MTESLDPADWASLARPRPPHARRHARLYRAHPRAAGLAADPRRGARQLPRAAAGGTRAIWPRSTRPSCTASCPTPPAIPIPASWAGCMAAATAVGMLAEMLAAGLNANLGGRDHMPIEVERQIARWMARAVRLSRDGERAVRHRHLDGQSDGACWWRATPRWASASRSAGVAEAKQRLVAYVSTAAHGCIARRWRCPGSAARRCA